MVSWCDAYQLPMYGVHMIQVNWEAPDSNGGAWIDRYTIEIWENGHYQVAYTIGADQTSGTVDALSSGRYEVRFRAHNIAGDGGYCVQIVEVY